MKVAIDKRPIWLLFILKYKNFFILTITFLLFFILTKYQPQELTVSGYRVVLVTVLCGFLWGTNIIPPAITGLLVIALIPLLNILPSKKTYALFGNEPVFFILSALIITIAMDKSKLSKRITLYFLSLGGDSEIKLAFSIYLLAAALSFLIPEHSVAALLFPIVKEITQVIDLKKGTSKLGKLLFLSLAWGAIIGGIATFMGGARNALAIGLLEEIGGVRIELLEWMTYSLPLVLYLLIIGFLVLVLFFKPEKANIAKAQIELQKKLKKLPPFTFKELLVAIIVIATVIGWVVVGHHGVGLAAIALISAILFLVLGIIDWKDAEKQINWGIIFMYGGAITLGSAFSQTDASKVFLSIIGGFDNLTVFQIAFICGILALALTEFISNSAVVALVLPIILKTAMTLNLNLKIITISVALMSGLAFALPIGSPSNAIAYTGEHYSIKESLKVGLLMNFFAALGLYICLKKIW